MKKIMIMAAVLLASVASLEAKPVQRFSIESGIVQYEISGGGEVMGMVVKTQGTKSLYFKNYGALMLEEEESTTVQGGSVNNEDKKHILTKTNNITVYKVNFRNKQIFKDTDQVASQYLASGKSMAEDSQKMMQNFGGKKVGMDTVLGYSCEIWELMGGKQCLYKGQIPLWSEVDVMGISNKTRAVKAEFGIKVSADKFELPKYSITESPMYMSEEQAIKQAEKMLEMKQVMQGVQEQMIANPNMTESEQEALAMKAISQSGMWEDMLSKKREQVPKILKVLKNSRSCLSKAENEADAKSCQQASLTMAKSLGLEDNDNDKEDSMPWNKKDKARMLAEMDEGIKEMEEALPCLNKAKTMEDLMHCQE